MMLHIIFGKFTKLSASVSHRDCGILIFQTMGKEPGSELQALLSQHCHPQHRGRALSLLEKLVAETRMGGDSQTWIGGVSNAGGSVGSDGWGAVTPGMGAWGGAPFAAGGDMGGVPMGSWGGGFGGGGGWFGGGGAVAPDNEAAVLNMALEGPGLG